MSDLLSLPPEVLIKIVHELKVRDIFSIAQTCKVLEEIANIESIWEAKISQDFKIDLNDCKSNPDSPNPKSFYKNVLAKLGKYLGSWQQVTFGHYGAIYQLVFHDWTLRFIQWIPPYGSIGEPMKVQDFLEITLNAETSKPQITLVDTTLYADQEENLDIIISTTHEDKLSIFFANLSPLRESEAEKSKVNEMFAEFVKLETGKELDLDDDGIVEQFEFPLSFLSYKFSNKINGRNVLGFHQLKAIEICSNEKPIARGIFKGNYGPHGTELIAIDYPSDGKMEGTKLTGDPNVPMNKVSFWADLTKAMVLTREDQTGVDCQMLMSSNDLFTYQNINFKSDVQPLPQPFILPPDAYDRSVDQNFKNCLYRFLGEGQIASHNYVNSEFIGAHVMIFDCDSIGVLFGAIGSMTVYSRVKEDFYAVNYKDIFK